MKSTTGLIEAAAGLIQSTTGQLQSPAKLIEPGSVPWYSSVVRNLKFPNNPIV